MSLLFKSYLLILACIVLSWLFCSVDTISDALSYLKPIHLLGVITLYLISHVFRILRLTLLTLHERGKALPLVMARTLTAFPSSFLPLKIGEILRLSAFFYAYDYKKKALAIWLSERFGDIVVISLFILSLHVLNKDGWAVDAAEKTRISAYASIGLYWFANTNIYIEAYKRFFLKKGTW